MRITAARLSQAIGERAAALDVIIRVADELGVTLCLVGGPVRDLLLGRPIGDLDLLLADRLGEIARECARRLHARVIVHERFLTATLLLGPVRIDLSRARRERYPRPGVLPRVSPAPLEEDFERRDFSVNALALKLSRERVELIDHVGGLRDLQQRRLRVLHDRSFDDDPTRLFRAARYCARLDFRLEPHTARLLRRAVADRSVATLSGDRRRHEIELLIDEADPARALRETDRRGLLAAIAPGWRLGSNARRALARLGDLRGTPPWPEAAQPALQRECGLRLLLAGQPKRIRTRALEGLGLRGRRAARVALDLVEIASHLRALERRLSPGALDARLSGLPEPALLALYCLARARARRDLLRFVWELRGCPDPIDGHRARAQGALGRHIGELVRAARQRALDGGTVDDAWIQRWLARRVQIR